MSTTNLTTTNIGVDELKHLKKLALNHKLKQVEFINASISYFRKTGINPAEEIYSPREEIEKLTKRVDEVIKFMQVHERQRLTPLMERLILLDKRISESITNANPEDPNKPESNLQRKHFIEMQNEISFKIERVRDLLREDLESIFIKQRKTIEIIELLYLCHKHSISGNGFKDVDIIKIENALSEIR